MLTETKDDTTNLTQWVRELTELSLTPASDSAEVETFDNISYIIKQVFENGKESAFDEALASYIERKNSEIEKVCGLHYQVRLSFLGRRRDGVFIGDISTSSLVKKLISNAKWK
jgi:hypothetical protein